MRDLARRVTLLIAILVVAPANANDDTLPDRSIPVVVHESTQQVTAVAVSSFPPTKDLAKPSPGTPLLRVLQDRSGLRLVIALPDEARRKAATVEIAVSALHDLRLPPIGWGRDALRERAYRTADDCSRPPVGREHFPEADCRAWFASMPSFDRHLAGDFIRRWRIDAGSKVREIPSDWPEQTAHPFVPPTDDPWIREVPTIAGHGIGPNADEALAIDVPWRILPPTDRLELTTVWVALRWCEAGRTAVLCHDLTPRKHNDGDVFVPVQLTPARHFRLTPCDYRMAAPTLSGSRTNAFFLPQEEEILEKVFALRWSVAAYQERPTLPLESEWAIPSHLELPDGSAICDANLQRPFRGFLVDEQDQIAAGTNNSHGAPSYDHRVELPNGDLLLVSGPRKGGSRTGEGQAGACARLNFDIVKVAQSDHRFTNIADVFSFLGFMCATPDDATDFDVTYADDASEYTTSGDYIWPPRDPEKFSYEARRLLDEAATSAGLVHLARIEDEDPSSDGNIHYVRIEDRYCRNADATAYERCETSAYFIDADSRREYQY